ncbi:transcriptional repressor [Candidatus Gracilibacteria bacterium]|nr:transcriptional repressor [Candidatus Gracilibacteria bacterium]
MKTHFYTDSIIEICDSHHLTVDEIFQCVSSKFEDVGKSSIYRNVEELVKKGKLTKVIGVGKKAYFEKTKNPHAHLIDEVTGEIFDIEEGSLGQCFTGNLPKNFKITDMDIKIFGRFN